MQILILAAGKSSRIYSKIGINKCLIEIKKDLTIIKKLILDLEYYNLKKIYISVGFNKNKIINHLKGKQNINFIYNKEFNRTGIVHSMINGLSNMKEQNTLVIYSDIVFNKILISRIKKLNAKNITLPVLYNWLKVWKKRGQDIRDDAENLIIKDQKIIEIGTKIKELDKVKYQYMGIVYIPKNLITILKDKYDNCQKNIDMTSFLNLLNKKDISLKPLKYSGEWYEIDNYKDLINFNKIIND